MDKVICLKNLLSCFTNESPSEIKGDTVVDVLEQFVEHFKKDEDEIDKSLTYATEEEVKNLFA